MPSQNLPSDATIRGIFSDLEKPEDYLCGVLGHMHKCNRKHKEAFVTIGTSGRGKSPHYRVGPDQDTVQTADAFRDTFVAYDGRNHKQLPWGLEELQNANWSSAKMSLLEVQSLLGELRQMKRH